MNEPETVDHPLHYGGADNSYEAIKVIEAWGLDFHLGNAIKYISRAGKKRSRLEDLKKAAWYLNRAIERAAEPPPETPLIRTNPLVDREQLERMRHDTATKSSNSMVPQTRQGSDQAGPAPMPDRQEAQHRLHNGPNCAICVQKFFELRADATKERSDAPGS